MRYVIDILNHRLGRAKMELANHEASLDRGRETIQYEKEAIIECEKIISEVEAEIKVIEKLVGDSDG